MKKKLAMVLILAGLLAGCATQPNGDASTGAPNSGGVDISMVEPDDGGALSYDLSESYMGSGTEAGFYFLKQDWFAMTQNITYLDYATQKHVYLCSSLNCTHDDDSCTSFLPGNTSASIWIIDDKLVLPVYGRWADEEMTNYIPSHIVTMDLNGANRKTLMQLGQGEEMSITGVRDGNGFYIIKSSYADDADESEMWMTKRELARVSMADGAVTAVCELKDWCFIMGAEGRTLTLQTYEDAQIPAEKEQELNELTDKLDAMALDPDAYSKEDIMEVEMAIDTLYREADARRLVRLDKLNVDTGELQPYKQWEMGDLVGNLDLKEGVMWFVEEETGHVKKRNLDTDEVTLVTDQLPKLEKTEEYMNEYYISSIYTNWLFLDYTKQEGEIFGTGRYAVNRQTGEAKEVTLRPDVVQLAGLLAQGTVRPLLDDTPAVPQTPKVVFTNGAWGYDPVPVVTEVGDQFLVVRRYDMRTEMTEGKMGEMYPVEVETPIYALISQDDYVNSRPNYLEVEMIA